ncbi:MAG TPA: 30S ribosomal protein S2 [Rubrobacteraceae bacterium]|nr:30S ribosomal protein S2 [Rubrobacteraceae bacterium]
MESTTEQVGIRELLGAGVHFGHQAKRWNPKMKPYIFAERSGVHIIDLDQTLPLLNRACSFVRSIAEAGRDVLFVGTKKQAQITVAEQAIRCGQPYVAERYIGGMLTNFQTIKPRIEYFKDRAARYEETPEEDRSGREWFALAREYQKLRRNFAGLTEMERLPGAVFVIDPKREELMVKEANRLRIPVVAITDTNCDPEVIDYVIPGNDDAIRSINLVAKLISGAILEGKGEDEVQPEDRPLPPVMEETAVSEEALPEEPVANGDGTSEKTVVAEAGIPEDVVAEAEVSEPEVSGVEAAEEGGAPETGGEEPVPTVEDTDPEAAGGDAEAAAAAAAEAAAEDEAQVEPEPAGTDEEEEEK